MWSANWSSRDLRREGRGHLRLRPDRSSRDLASSQFFLVYFLFTCFSSARMITSLIYKSCRDLSSASSAWVGGVVPYFFRDTVEDILDISINGSVLIWSGELRIWEGLVKKKIEDSRGAMISSRDSIIIR